MSRRDRSVDGIVFGAVLLVAVPLYLALRFPVWFGLDDWDPLTSRSIGSWSDLVRPHFDHFSVVPVVVYRMIFPFAGLDSRPYQLVTIVMHLTAAILLRALVLRSGVDRWIATAVGVVFVGFAAGHQNITYGFGMSFTVVLVLGLGQLLLADHEGRWSVRDWTGVVFAVVAVMSSGVAVTASAVVFAAVCSRRGFRTATAYVAPAALVYVVWWVSVGRRDAQFADVATVWEFARSHAWGMVRTLGGTPWLAAIWIVLLATGLAVTVAELRESGRRSQVVNAAALAGGAVFYVLSTGFATPVFDFYPPVWPAPRHLHVMVTMLLPMTALGADRLVRARQGSARVTVRVVVIALVLAGLPSGFAQLAEERTSLEAEFASNARLLLTAPRLSFAAQLPSDLELDPVFTPGVTMGWLRELDTDGLLPLPPRTTPLQRAGVAALVALDVDAYDGVPVEDCTVLAAGSTRFVLKRGEQLIVVNAPATVKLVYEGTASVGERVEAAPFIPGVRRALAGPLRLTVQSVDPDEQASVCVRSLTGE